MILFYIFILIPFIAATPYERPSYRSSVMDGDKPILRMPTDLGGYESDDEESGEPQEPIYGTRDPQMVRDVSLLIEWLVENFGYDIGSVQGRRTKDDFLSKSFDRSKKALRQPTIKNKQVTSITRTGDKKPMRSSAQTQNGDPSWMADLKEFIKDLVTRFGQEDLDRYTKPVISSLEKKHDVTVTDIDVNQYGEILIKHVENEKKPKPEAKALRYRTPEDDEEKSIIK